MKSFKCIAILLISLLFLSGCSKKESNNNPTPLKTVIKVGTSADYPPFEFLQNGQIVGFDIDVIKAVCAELNYEVEIRDMDFNALLTALKVGQIDCIIASLSPTKERKKNVDFSIDYFDPEPIAILSQESDPIQSLESLKGKIIGVQMGSTMETLAKKLVEEYQIAEVKSLSKNNLLIEELKVGRIAGVIVGRSQGIKFSQNNPQLFNLSLPLKGEACAIAFKKGSFFREPFNKALTKLKESGALQSIAQEWLLY